MVRTLLVAAALLVPAVPVRAEEAKADKDTSKLVGTWTVTAAQKDGKEEAATNLKGKEVKITKDTITCTDKDGKTEMACKYTVDTSGKTWQVSMECTEGAHKGKKVKGIMKLDGDTLKVCYAKPDKDAPTSFKTGEDQCSVTLKRAEK